MGLSDLIYVLTFLSTVEVKYCVLKYLYCQPFWDGFDEGIVHCSVKALCMLCMYENPTQAAHRICSFENPGHKLILDFKKSSAFHRSGAHQCISGS